MNATNLEFKTEVGGKWILSGEHAVLQGAHSVALPLSDIKLRITIRKRDRRGPPLERSWDGLRRRLYDLLGIDLEHYELEIDNRVPVGAGLGSSAALCVALGKWVKWLNPEIEQSEEVIAQELENEFHGRSSGMDIQVVSKNKPILFKEGQIRDSLDTFSLGSQIFTLHWTGRPKSTREAIDKVQDWCRRNPAQSKVSIEKMDDASIHLWKALLLMNRLGLHEQALKTMELGINQAHSCFEEWGLIPSDLLPQRKELMKRGARAVKLTGAGLGGYWIALWDVEQRPGPKGQILIDRPLAGL